MRPATPALSALAGLCALAASCGGESRAVHARQGRYNVVIVSIDTLRADHVGAYGYERPTTPLLDRLAGEGTRFERCYSQATYTLPSHMSLLTGLFPSQHAVEDPARALLDPELVTFPELFRERGFSTAAFTEGGLVTAEYGFSHGFDVYRESAMFGTLLPLGPPP